MPYVNHVFGVYGGRGPAQNKPSAGSDSVCLEGDGPEIARMSGGTAGGRRSISEGPLSGGFIGAAYGHNPPFMTIRDTP